LRSEASKPGGAGLRPGQRCGLLPERPEPLGADSHPAASAIGQVSLALYQALCRAKTPRGV